MNEVYDNGSFWFDSLDELEAPEVPTNLPSELDVAIIGAGFTGLWTAYYLNKSQPELKIGVFEANTVGFGASGRNGGWCMGWAMGIEELLANPAESKKGLALARSMQSTVDEIGAVCQAENIDCHYEKGGTLTVATRPFDAVRMQAAVKKYHESGLSEEDFVWLNEQESRQRINMEPNFGAMYTPHCAAIHPARLVRGLGDVVRKKGVLIFERTPVKDYSSKVLRTENATVSVPIILRATEGYTDSIKGQKRKLMPIYSMMVATEPLPESVWADIGLKKRETFGDTRRITTYGQRTLDDRLAFGGRAGYYFGSKRIPVMAEEDPLFEEVESVLRSFFPILKDYRITHKWGGLMGVPRHWRPSVLFDPTTGLGSAGGYTGEGVGASNLAARILADLALGNETDITKLAWVNDEPRRWEIEPFRWLGANAIQWFGARADEKEFSTGKPSILWGKLFDYFAG
jgi:glycine/D-amino acid oxidase-like deaminating enzyme